MSEFNGFNPNATREGDVTVYAAPTGERVDGGGDSQYGGSTAWDPESGEYILQNNIRWVYPGGIIATSDESNRWIDFGEDYDYNPVDKYGDNYPGDDVINLELRDSVRQLLAHVDLENHWPEFITKYQNCIDIL